MDSFLKDLIGAFTETAGTSANSTECRRSVECVFGELQDFIVDDSTDIVVKQQEVQPAYILLAESPHICEVNPKHKYPMAGDTGKEVSRVLGETIGLENANELDALGSLLSQPCPPPCWRRFGIMNVSRLPLQKEAYTENDYTGTSQCFSELLDAFGTLRGDMSVRPESRRKPKTCRVQKAILSDLQARLNRLSDRIAQVNPARPFHIVPCGQVADDALDQICVPSGLTKLDAIPHPARNQWRNARNLSSWLDKLG